MNGLLTQFQRGPHLLVIVHRWVRNEWRLGTTIPQKDVKMPQREELQAQNMPWIKKDINGKRSKLTHGFDKMSPESAHEGKKAPCRFPTQVNSPG